jgi:hypothetical protein
MGENQTAWHDQNLPVFTESLFRILHNDTHRKEKSGIYAVQQSVSTTVLRVHILFCNALLVHFHTLLYSINAALFFSMRVIMQYSKKRFSEDG